MKDIFQGSNIKKIYQDLDYSIFTIPKNELITKINNNITIPEFQREMNQDKVISIFKESNDHQKWFNTHGSIIIGRIEKTNDFSYFLLDGQHRVEALKKCKNNFLIICQVIDFDSINSMKYYFKSINQNTNFDTEYLIFDSEYIECIRKKLQEYIKNNFKDVFIKSKESTGNRYNINEFLNLFTPEIIEDFYNDINKDYDDGKLLVDEIISINNTIKEFFDEFKNKKTISDYLSARDNIADDKLFYLCLKNINFIDCIRNTNNDIPCPTKINSKRPKIDNNLRDLVWNTYIGSDCKKGKCYCCPRTIDYTLFECGHLKSHKNGGKTDLKNLRPFCFHCNRSLGSNDFIEKINKSI
jgi:hypothetical protein